MPEDIAIGVYPLRIDIAIIDAFIMPCDDGAPRSVEDDTWIILAVVGGT
jgi:hypothetical protein